MAGKGTAPPQGVLLNLMTPCFTARGMFCPLLLLQPWPRVRDTSCSRCRQHFYGKVLAPKFGLINRLRKMLQSL